MKIEGFRWLMAVIHWQVQHGKTATRVRLQKIVMLLQQIEFPTRYSYSIHFYGPYSEGFQADMSLLTQSGMIKESEQSQDGYTYHICQVVNEANLPDLAEWESVLSTVCNYDTSVMEITAIYTYFINVGFDRDVALEKLHWKKSQLCTDENLENMELLLKELELTAA